MSRLLIAVVLALAVFGASANLDPATLAQHCKALTVYTSGPGSYEDYLNRQAFYLAETGNFQVPGSETFVKSAADWVAQTADSLKQYKTFNHVFLPEEPIISGNVCTFEVTHGFLAWDGACGPLLTKSVVSYKVSGADAASAKIVEFRIAQNQDNILAQIESCNPDSSNTQA